MTGTCVKTNGEGKKTDAHLNLSVTLAQAWARDLPKAAVVVRK